MRASTVASAGSLLALCIGRAWSLAVTVPPIVVNLGPQIFTWNRDPTDPQIFFVQLQVEDNGGADLPGHDYKGFTINAFDKTEGTFQFIQLIPPFNDDVGDGVPEGTYFISVIDDSGKLGLAGSKTFQVVGNKTATASSVLADFSSLATGTQTQSTSTKLPGTTSTTSSTTTSEHADTRETTTGSTTASATVRPPDPTPVNKAGVIAGSVIGGLFALGIILAAIYLVWRRRRARARMWKVGESHTGFNPSSTPSGSGANLVQPYMVKSQVSTSQKAVPVSFWKSGKGVSPPPSETNTPPSSKGSGSSRPGHHHTESASNHAHHRNNDITNSRRPRRESETERLRDEVQNLRREVEFVRAERDMALDRPPPMYDSR